MQCQIGTKTLHVARRGIQPVKQFHRPCSVTGSHRIRKRKQMVASRHAGNLRHQRRRHMTALPDALVQCGKRVAHAAVCQTGDQHRRVVVECEALLCGNKLHTSDHRLRCHTFKIKALAAGEDRHGELVHLGRRKNEFDVRRRLFQCFEQRVERADGKHVHFVDDVYAEFARHGRKRGFLADVADVVHTVVGGGVDLDHIEDRAGIDPAADLTFAAGVAVFR